MRKAARGPAVEVAPEAWNRLRSSVAEASSALMRRIQDTGEVARFNDIAERATHANEAAWICIEAIQEFEKQKSKGKEVSAPTRQSMFDYELHWLRELAGTLIAVRDFARSEAAAAADSGALLLVGGAGTGKTHLLCDVALTRLRKGMPTVLLLGTHFEDAEPLAQIPTRILGLQIGRDEFLASLDAAGEACGNPALILIDAINEGDGRSLWSRFLAGMLQAIRRYPHIAIAFSVRDSYEDLVVPAGLDEDLLPYVHHPGFAGHEYRATQTYFDHYGLKAPTIPLLNPEFDNPQFLKLFCKTLVNMGKTGVPRGLRGVAAIFDGFLDSVNEKLAHRDVLDYEISERPVHKSVEILVDEMLSAGSSGVNPTVARQKINGLLPRTGASKSLYRHLIDEDVIYEDRHYDYKSNGFVEIVRFSFERFSDHLLAKRMLDVLNSKNEVAAALAAHNSGSDTEGEWQLRMRAGLIEALSIQVPSKFGDELIAVCPAFKESRVAAAAFLRGIPWREPATIGPQTRALLNELYQNRLVSETEVLHVLILVAGSVEHPWNAEFLHRNLLGRRLNIRDATWSIFVFNEYNEEASLLQRLMTWAAGPSTSRRFDDDSVKLVGIVLSWVLATSHRFARDQATKSLVALLTGRINVLIEILLLFETVDDMYILERLYCVAYGCAMLAADDSGIAQLSEETYRIVFSGEEAIPHILLRDYARGVIEVAIHRGVNLSLDPTKARPPYKSTLVEPSFTPGELESWSDYKNDMPREEWAKRRIYHSVMGQEDFARYIIGTNSGSFEWSSKPLGAKSRRHKDYDYEKDRFDLRFAQRWIMRRVIDLGWKTELFGAFDARVTSGGREEHKSERIGKKYQWIAYHEFLAKVSDNCEFIGESWPRHPRQYDGPWQAGYVRDIDPSCVLRTTSSDSDAACWWQPLKYEWDVSLTHGQWLQRTDDLPPFESGLLVTDEQGKHWYVLESNFDFSQPKTLQEEEERESSLPVRQVWTQLRSYFVHRRDFGRFIRWAEEQHFMGRWMPEARSAGQLFLGEYFWSPAFQYFEQPYYQRYAWTKGNSRKTLPVSVLVTADGYFWDRGLDCSIEDKVSLRLPCRALAESLDLRWNGVAGQYLSNGVVAVQDPSTALNGPSSLLVEQEALWRFLEKQNLALVWTVLGEKVVYEDDRDNWPGRLEFSGSYGLREDNISTSLRTVIIAGRRAR
jgi:hypothetical protein